MWANVSVKVNLKLKLSLYPPTAAISNMAKLSSSMWKADASFWDYIHAEKTMTDRHLNSYKLMSKLLFV